MGVVPDLLNNDKTSRNDIERDQHKSDSNTRTNRLKDLYYEFEEEKDNRVITENSEETDTVVSAARSWRLHESEVNGQVCQKCGESLSWFVCGGFYYCSHCDSSRDDGQLEGAQVITPLMCGLGEMT